VPAVWVGAAVLALAAVVATFVPGRRSMSIHLPKVPERSGRLVPVPVALRADD
jgi:hypothetical protein